MTIELKEVSEVNISRKNIPKRTVNQKGYFWFIVVLNRDFNIDIIKINYNITFKINGFTADIELNIKRVKSNV